MIMKLICYSLLVFLPLHCQSFAGNVSIQDLLSRQIKMTLQTVADLWKQHREAQAAISLVMNSTAFQTKQQLHPLLNTIAPNPTMKYFRDCRDVYAAGLHASGVYHIWTVRGYRWIPIYCDMDCVGEFSNQRGWMTIQRRITGEVTFDRDWSDYVHGFGYPYKEHWIGLENIYALTSQHEVANDMKKLALRIDLEDWLGNRAFAEYESFGIDPMKYEYALASTGAFRGTPGMQNPLAFLIFVSFSTRDHNNDIRRRDKCVQEQTGGWWFGTCKHSNLNGKYPSNQTASKTYMYTKNWDVINPSNAALRYVSMKVQ